jgi:hypothetical protein
MSGQRNGNSLGNNRMNKQFKNIKITKNTVKPEKPAKNYKDKETNKEEIFSKNTNIYATIDEDCDNEATVQPQVEEPVKASRSKNVTIVEPKETKQLKDEDGEWTVYKKKAKQKKQPRLVSRHFKERYDEPEENDEALHDTGEQIQENLDPNDTGAEYKFNTRWIVWAHLIDSADWSPESYTQAYVIDNISSFWKFFNNADRLDFDKYQFYIMREGSQPQWEHISNRHGGTCSLRVSKNKSNELIEQLAILVINESFSDNPSDINGLSYGSKQNWCIVKVWNQDRKNDTSNHVPVYMTKRYSTQPRYKRNEPEY